MTRVAIGVGCRRGCSGAAIETLVRQALDIYLASGYPLSPSFPRKRESIDQQHDGVEMDSRFRGNDDLEISVFAGLFTIIDKRDEPGLAEAAALLGLNLTYLARDALEARINGVQTRSEKAGALFGVPSVAEAAALAGAGPESVLIVPRISGGGATCAIAGAAS
jgi:cobalt-precorrin 5A hydrolase